MSRKQPISKPSIKKGAEKGLGLGEAVGLALLGSKFPFLSTSLLAKARQMDIPVTVHVAIGTDIIHLHPSMDARATGQTSHKDFKLFVPSSVPWKTGYI